MAYKRKTAREMLESKNEVHIEKKVKPRGNLRGSMVIPPATEYEELMKKVPRKKVLTMTEIREYFADKYKVNFCCPLVSGIFVNLVARAAEEDMDDGNMKIDEVTPYWRTLKSGGELNPKYPGGVDAQASKLKEEGFDIELNRNGKPKKVKDYSDMVYKLK